jgi:sulfatase modifying factor 1
MPGITLDPAVAFFPNPFPEPWASDWGEDDLGLWMGLTLGKVRQVFRWIAPGRFLMGSPPDEPSAWTTKCSTK